MSATLLLTRREVARLLPMVDCIAAVEAALRAEAEQRTLPSRVLGLHGPAGGIHVKAAGLWRDRLYLAVKVNANFPGNPARGLPTIQGLVALVDGEDGRLLALLDSMELTALRTAAATGVAAKHLARADAATLVLCGCGAQAAHQVRAIAAVRAVRRVVAYDQDRARALAWARETSDGTGLAVDVADDFRAAAAQGDMIVTCTPSRQPLLGANDVAAGAFVAGVGADHPEKNELGPDLLARGRLVVDSLEQAATIGDLHHAVAAGVLRREDVHAELWEVAAGRKPGRAGDDGITVFDSTGIALEDVAAAALAYERALATGAGQGIDLGS